MFFIIVNIVKSSKSRLKQIQLSFSMKKFKYKNIYSLIEKSFNDEELSKFLLFNFEDLYDEISEGMTKSRKVELLLNYCKRRLLLEKLLKLIEAENPAQYNANMPYFVENNEKTKEKNIDLIKQNEQKIVENKKAEQKQILQEQSTNIQQNVIKKKLNPEKVVQKKEEKLIKYSKIEIFESVIIKLSSASLIIGLILHSLLFEEDLVVSFYVFSFITYIILASANFILLFINKAKTNFQKIALSILGIGLLFLLSLMFYPFELIYVIGLIYLIINFFYLKTILNKYSKSWKVFRTNFFKIREIKIY